MGIHIYSSRYEGCPDKYFSYFSVKTYVVGTHSKRLGEALVMRTHNIF